jgi:hypothetical protein
VTIKLLEQHASKCAKRRLGTRFVETRYDADAGIVEFNACVASSEEAKKRYSVAVLESVTRSL